MQFPIIYCPFPSDLNPHVEVADEHTLAWATQFLLVQKDAAAMRRFLALRIPWLTARAYPLVGPEELSLLNDWAAWLLLLDDQVDDRPIGGQPANIQAILDDFLAIFTDPAATSPPGPAAAALGDLCQRTFAQASDVWRQRFIEHFAQHFNSVIWSVNNTAQGRVPTLKAYLQMRRRSGGMTMAIDLIELAEHFELPAALLASPEFATFPRLTNDFVCWSNDLFSLQKERARSDVNNLVVVLQHFQRLTLQQAVDRVNEMLGNAVHQFEQTEHALPAFAPELAMPIRKYLSDLKSWMRANLDWSAETHRYAHVESDEAMSYLVPTVGAPHNARGK